MTNSTEILAPLRDSDSMERRVLRLLIELGAQFVAAAEGSLLVYDSEERDLEFVMTVGGPPGLVGKRVPIGSGLTGLAAVTREVQIGSPTFDVPNSGSGGSEPEAVIAAPMLVADNLVGVLTAVSFTSGKRFSSRDGDLYGRLAAVAGVVVDQGRRLRAVESRAEPVSRETIAIEELLLPSSPAIRDQEPASRVERLMTKDRYA